MNRSGFLAWFASNHVAANILMIFILVAGALAMSRTLVEVFPEIDAGMITVQVPYLGAAPAEVEEGVCMRVEEAVVGIEGVERVRSTAQEGLGVITIELDEGADVRKALDDVKNEVDRIETFPAETEKPVISELTSRTQVITVVLSGDVDEASLKHLAERVRDDLTTKDTISQVEVSGVRRFEISIEVSEENLRRYQLSFDQVAMAVRRASLDMPGGTVKTDGGEILIRTKGQLYRGSEFADIVVLQRADGSRVRLGDVAEVIDGFEDSDLAARFDGAPSASIQVFRIGSQGALEIADEVRQYVEELEPNLPAGIEVSTWEDRSQILRSRIDLLLRNGRLGLILVFLSLALFLDLRLAFWTTIGIPISFLGAFLIIQLGDVSINMISLFAFIVSLGIVVDDAIVVGENVFALREKGMSPLDAAIEGVREMASPVTFAILTTVAAFMPLMFVSGQMGKVMRQIPIVVIAVILVSLVEALLILPSHLANRKREASGGPIARFQGVIRRSLDGFIEGPYRRTLEVAIRNRYLTVAAAVAIFVATMGYVAGGHINFTFMPRIDADNMVAALTMPQGTPLEETRRVVERLEAAAEQVRQEFDDDLPDDSQSIFRHVASTIGEQPRTSRGGGGPTHGPGGPSASSANIAEVNVELLAAEGRPVSTRVLTNRWRELVGEVPGVSSLTFSSSLFSAGEDINVELSHASFDRLLEAAGRLEEEVIRHRGVSDVADSFLPGKRELELELTAQGHASGLTLRDLALQVRSGFYGAEAQRVQRGRDDVRVMVRYPESARRSLAGIEAMRVRLPGGGEAPFVEVARVDEGRGYAAISRTDRRRVVSITASVDETVANANDINRDLKNNVLPQLERDFPGLTASFEGQDREQRESMGSLGLNLLMAQVAIFCLLAVPFKSYVQPLIVMCAIPFGFVGAILGHVIMGFDLTLLSFFGVVALTGVVVNDSLIMIDLINRERAEGVPLDQVLIHSGVRRFRPILLTTLTTFLGLTPMILETSIQAQFLVPMAISLGFGVAFATAITLLLVPSLYRILEDVLSVIHRRKPVDAAERSDLATLAPQTSESGS